MSHRIDADAWHAELPRDSYQQSARGPDYLPTPEEIRAACDAIQLEWSPMERRRRQRGLVPDASGQRCMVAPGLTGWRPPRARLPAGTVAY